MAVEVHHGQPALFERLALNIYRFVERRWLQTVTIFHLYFTDVIDSSCLPALFLSLPVRLPFDS